MRMMPSKFRYIIYVLVVLLTSVTYNITAQTLEPQNFLKLTAFVKTTADANKENAAFGEQFSAINSNGQSVSFGTAYSDVVTLSALATLYQQISYKDSEMTGLCVHYGLKPATYTPVIIYEPVILKFKKLDGAYVDFDLKHQQRYFVYNQNTNQFVAVSDVTPMTNLYYSNMRVKDQGGNVQPLQKDVDPNSITFPWAEIDTLVYDNKNSASGSGTININTATKVVFSYAAVPSAISGQSYYIQTVTMTPVLDGAPITVKNYRFANNCANMGAMCPPNCPPVTIQYSAK